jgi:hypothetical protein
MRTLPSVPRGPARVRTRRRLAAYGVLAGAVATLAALAGAPADPLAVGRSAYRATIRARGGTFVSSPGVVLQSGVTDCGPAALATLIHALGGTPPPTDSLARLAETGARGTTFAGLARTAQLLGVATELRRLDPAALDALSTPVIAWVDGGHFVTVVPDSLGSALVLDPQVGPYRIGRADLRRYWAGEALVPARTEARPVGIPR